jgi:hypothetical protein
MSIAELNEQIWLHKEMVHKLEHRSMRFKMSLLKFEGGLAKKWRDDEKGHGRLFCELVIMGLDEEEQMAFDGPAVPPAQAEPVAEAASESIGEAPAPSAPSEATDPQPPAQA